MKGPLKKDGNRKNVRLNAPLKNTENTKIKALSFKYKKEALAITIAVLITLIVLILTSGSPDVPQATNQSSNQTPDIASKVYSAGGIYLEYPYSWSITKDEIDGNNMQLMIQDPVSANNSDSAQAAGFTVLKVQKDPYETLEQRKDSFIQSMSSAGANLAPSSTKNITLNGINATETIYDGKAPTNRQLQLKLIYFQHGDIFYILAFLTKGTDLGSQQANFDVMLNSFKLQ